MCGLTGDALDALVVPLAGLPTRLAGARLLGLPPAGFLLLVVAFAGPVLLHILTFRRHLAAAGYIQRVSQYLLV